MYTCTVRASVFRCCVTVSFLKDFVLLICYRRRERGVRPREWWKSEAAPPAAGARSVLATTRYLPRAQRPSPRARPRGPRAALSPRSHSTHTHYSFVSFERGIISLLNSMIHVDSFYIRDLSSTYVLARRSNTSPMTLKMRSPATRSGLKSV